MSSAIEQAIRQICEEKGLAYEAVIDAIQAALAAAYRKDFGDKLQNIETVFDPETGATKIFDVKAVVPDVSEEELLAADEARKARAEAAAQAFETARAEGLPVPAIAFDEDDGPRFNPKNEIMISEAKALKDDIQIGEILRQELSLPGDFGRMAAMTAKQVIMQKLREAEREIIFAEFKHQEGTLVQATVQRHDGRIVFMDIGRATGLIRPEDQLPNERYYPGDRLQVFVKQVAMTMRGPEILLSRSSEEIVRALFVQEIPEITEGTVIIQAIAREGGSRSKVAVSAKDKQIDPIGACIGQRGTRIQTIISDLSGEKIDLIEWSEDPSVFIKHALSPAQIERIDLQEADHGAVVHVRREHLSLAIGKGGQNVRLASKLTGWRISIVETEESVADASQTDEVKDDEGEAGVSA